MKKKKKLDEGMIMVSSLLPVNRIDSLTRNHNDNFEFKGLPGQFNENGEKIMDDQGNEITKEALNEGSNVKVDINQMIKNLQAAKKLGAKYVALERNELLAQAKSAGEFKTLASISTFSF